jgi:hypothetical protein
MAGMETGEEGARAFALEINGADVGRRTIAWRWRTEE